MDTIVLKEIRFRYPEGSEVFSRLDFNFPAGGRIGITGPNGSGKSTLFKIITGLLRPLSGYVELFGTEMRKEKDFAAFRTRVGYLFQNPEDQILFPSVEEDLSFGPLNQGKSRHQAEEIVKQVLKQFGLESLKNRNPFRLSGGEKHLVALAGIAAMKPEILLMDEPFEWLDDSSMQAVLDYISQTPSFIIISRDKKMLSRICKDGVYILNNGLLKK